MMTTRKQKLRKQIKNGFSLRNELTTNCYAKKSSPDSEGVNDASLAFQLFDNNLIRNVKIFSDC